MISPCIIITICDIITVLVNTRSFANVISALIKATCMNTHNQANVISMPEK